MKILKNTFVNVRINQICIWRYKLIGLASIFITLLLKNNVWHGVKVFGNECSTFEYS